MAKAVELTIWDDLGRELGVEDFKAPGPMMSVVFSPLSSLQSPSFGWRFFGLEPVPGDDITGFYEDIGYPFEAFVIGLDRDHPDRLTSWALNHVAATEDDND